MVILTIGITRVVISVDYRDHESGDLDYRDLLSLVQQCLQLHCLILIANFGFNDSLVFNNKAENVFFGT